MTFLLIYAAAAVALSLYSLMHLLWPVMQEAKYKNIANAFTSYPKLSAFTAFLINLVVAPFWLVVLLIPAFEEAARTGLQNVILVDDENYKLD